ncbi:MAG: triple tyrosine motif-containing protein [Acidobacteriaceae bacterium]|nr:triple tyrosine motif-containing protein [Acidobacteriaceae bacterium]
MWVSYAFGGVSKIQGGVVTNFSTDEGLGTGQIRSIEVDQKGTIWLGGTDGLFLLVNNRIQRVGTSLGFPQQPVFRLAVDPANNLWVSTLGKVMVRIAGERRFQIATTIRGSGIIHCWPVSPKGARCFDPFGEQFHLQIANGRVIRFQDSKVPGFHSFLSAQDGSLWLSTDNQGILRLPSPTSSVGVKVNQYEQYAAQQGLSSNHAIVPVQDKEGSIWVSTDQGLDQFRSYSVRSMKLESDWSALNKRPGSGTVVIAANRLFDVSATQVHAMTTSISPQIRSLYGAVDGSIWVGTEYSLCHIVGDRILQQPLPHDLGSPLRSIQTITEDSRHNLWISIVRNGVYRLSGQLWLRNGGYSELPSEPAVSSGKDSTGSVWFGYLDGTAVSISPSGKVTRYGGSQGPNVGTIKVFGRDGSDVLVGGDKGIAILHAGKFHQLITADGSSFEGVTGIVLSSAKELWMNSSRGIIRVPAASYAQARTNPKAHLEFQIFDYRDGVQGAPTPIGGLGSAVEGNDGTLYFLDGDHLNWIAPSTVLHNPISPPVMIVKLDSNAASWRWPRAVELQPNPENVRVTFQAGSLRIPSRVRFRYFLENYDNTWIDGGNRHEAVYSKLPPGHYVFHVTACNDDGLWNEVGATLTITVLPTLTQRTMFRIFLGILLLAATFLVVHLRLTRARRMVAAQMYEIFDERQRIARDLHDTLLQSVQALIFKFSVITQKMPMSDPNRALLDLTLDQADLVLLDGRRMVANLHTSELETVALVESLRSVGEELEELHRIDFHLDAQGVERSMDSVVVREILAFGREALTNAFRHSEGRNVWLSLLATSKGVLLRVKDDGLGIHPTILQKGKREGHFGLQNMRDRAKRLGGRCTVISSAGEGSTIELNIPAYLAYTDAANGIWSRIRRAWKS